RRKKRALGPRRDDRGRAVARGGDRRPDGGCDRGPQSEAEIGDACRQIVEQILLAAEEMRAASDIEQDSVRCIERDERGIALARLGDALEEFGGGPGVPGNAGKKGMHGGALGEPHAGPQSQPLRRRRYRNEFFDIAALAGNGEEGGFSLPFRGGWLLP